MAYFRSAFRISRFDPGDRRFPVSNFLERNDFERSPRVRKLLTASQCLAPKTMAARRVQSGPACSSCSQPDRESRTRSGFALAETYLPTWYISLKLNEIDGLRGSGGVSLCHVVPRAWAAGGATS